MCRPEAQDPKKKPRKDLSSSKSSDSSESTISEDCSLLARFCARLTRCHIFLTQYRLYRWFDFLFNKFLTYILKPLWKLFKLSLFYFYPRLLRNLRNLLRNVYIKKVFRFLYLKIKPIRSKLSDVFIFILKVVFFYYLFFFLKYSIWFCICSFARSIDLAFIEIFIKITFSFNEIASFFQPNTWNYFFNLERNFENIINIDTNWVLLFFTHTVQMSKALFPQYATFSLGMFEWDTLFFFFPATLTMIGIIGLHQHFVYSLAAVITVVCMGMCFQLFFSFFRSFSFDLNVSLFPQAKAISHIVEMFWGRRFVKVLLEPYRFSVFATNHRMRVRYKRILIVQKIYLSMTGISGFDNLFFNKLNSIKPNIKWRKYFPSALEVFSGSFSYNLFQIKPPRGPIIPDNPFSIKVVARNLKAFHFITAPSTFISVSSLFDFRAPQKFSFSPKKTLNFLNFFFTNLEKNYISFFSIINSNLSLNINKFNTTNTLYFCNRYVKNTPFSSIFAFGFFNTHNFGYRMFPLRMNFSRNRFVVDYLPFLYINYLVRWFGFSQRFSARLPLSNLDLLSHKYVSYFTNVFINFFSSILSNDFVLFIFNLFNKVAHYYTSNRVLFIDLIRPIFSQFSTLSRLWYLHFAVIHSTVYMCEHLWLEFFWTVVPFLDILILMAPSISELYEEFSRNIDLSHLSLKVVGHQWYWSFHWLEERSTTIFAKCVEVGLLRNAYSKKTPYSGRFLAIWGNLRESFLHTSFPAITLRNIEMVIIPTTSLTFGDIRYLSVDNPLIVPVFTAFRLLITSQDVLHSFALPALGIKMDACPGRLNHVNTFLLHPGVFYGQCSELCGIGHGFMPVTFYGINSFFRIFK